jgi:hypothetical protein
LKDKPDAGDLLTKGLIAHDLLINLMRALRDSGALSREDGANLMTAVHDQMKADGSQADHALGQLKAEADLWKT